MDEITLLHSVCDDVAGPTEQALDRGRAALLDVANAGPSSTSALRRRWSPRKRWSVFGVVVIASAAVVTGFAAASAAPQPNPADWSLSPTQIALARQALMLTATQMAPAGAIGAPGRITGAWPSNLTDGTAFGTDRGAANAAMGEAGAVTGADATHQVICVEAHGHFSTASLPHPQGTQPQTYTYAVTCFDPTTAKVTDTGYTNSTVRGTFNSRTKLNITNAITHTVK
ncbi:MAG: hypothetical protein JWP75_2719 [Frondihabitans sp.]|nr:hypothetical protein [Frondihabitans sp.]